MSTTETKDSAEPAATLFVGRQPILDLDLKVYGHELLFRAGTENAFSGNVEHAAQSIMDNSLLLFPLGNSEVSFINCTKSTIISGFATLLPPASTVLEILETVEPDEEFFQCCQTLRLKGYRFALDDFSAEDPLAAALIDIADFIKIDFLALNKESRRKVYDLAAGRKVKLLAEKIETDADFADAKTEGCVLFQGYFFCRPLMVPTRIIPQNKLIYIRLLSELARSPADIPKIEELVMSDTSITYRLLRLVNSVLYQLPQPISSIRGALLMIGDDEFRKLVTLALANAASTPEAKVAIRIALERAKFCELLAPYVKESASTLYLLGMLSLIDVILGIAMFKVLESLPLDPKMKAGLLMEPGPLNDCLALIREREAGNWTAIDDLQGKLGVPVIRAGEIHAAAIQWADRVSRWN